MTHNHRIDLDRRLVRWAEQDEPGCVVGVVEEGELLFAEGFGVEDLASCRPITVDSRFDIASEAKQFTGACIALLERDRHITMDDEIGEVLPELPDVFRRIAIRQLLHHTAGVPDFYEIALANGLLEQTCVLETVYRVICEMKSAQFPPGDRFEYSNSGYALLATIIERVEGVPFGEVLSQRILRPLGMADSFVHDTPGGNYPRHAKGHVFDAPSGYCERWYPRYAVPGAGCLYASVRDLARWLTGLHGGTFGTPPLARQMLRPGRLNDGSETRYGLGLDWGQCFEPSGGVPIITHGGSHGGSQAMLLHAPEHGFCVILLCNNRRIEHVKIALDLAQRLARKR